MLLWSLRHHYLGLGGDARLYAVQALARIHPNLFNDLYLRNASQDSYTLFSSLYAPCIGLIGLANAALTLTLVFKILFFAASWVLARCFFQGTCAFLAVAVLILIPGAYGAFGVFQYAEDWLTARSAAEALVVTAIACSMSGRRLWGLLIACAAMALHPLMALPGLLWLVCLWLPVRLSAMGSGRRHTFGADYRVDRLVYAVDRASRRDGCCLAGGRPGTLAIPPAPVLARQRLEPERSALSVIVDRASWRSKIRESGKSPRPPS